MHENVWAFNNAQRGRRSELWCVMRPLSSGSCPQKDGCSSVLQKKRNLKINAVSGGLIKLSSVVRHSGGYYFSEGRAALRDYYYCTNGVCSHSAEAQVQGYTQVCVCVCGQDKWILKHWNCGIFLWGFLWTHTSFFNHYSWPDKDKSYRWIICFSPTVGWCVRDTSSGGNLGRLLWF